MHVHIPAAVGDPSSPARLEALQGAALKAAEQVHPAPLWRDVARLHALFTHDRAERASGYLREPPLRRAYLGYFAPLNAAKVARVLMGLQAEGRWQPPPHPRVLDLGAGPLSGIAGAWVAHGTLGECVAVDLATRAMEDGRIWLERAGAETAGLALLSRNVIGPMSLLDLSSGARGAFDLVLACNVLNEVGDPRRDLERRRQLVENALACVAPGGGVLLLEPGTRVHGRALQRLRDEIVLSGSARVLAPCLGTQPCPLLLREADWCHHESAWEPSARVRDLEERAGLRKRVLHYSYLWLSRPDAPSSRPRSPVPEVRIVGGVMGEERARRYGCAAEGLVVMEHASGRLPGHLQQALRGRVVPREGAGYRTAPVQGGDRATVPQGRRKAGRHAEVGRHPPSGAAPPGASPTAGAQSPRHQSAVDEGKRPPRSRSRRGRGARES